MRLKPLCTATCISTEHHTHGTLRYRALHGKDVCCPLHGTPDPGRRLRPRLRPIDVDRVRAAIDRWQQCTDLDRQASTLQAQMRHLEKALLAYQASPFPSKIHHSPTRPEHAEGFTIHHSLFPPEQQ